MHPAGPPDATGARQNARPSRRAARELATLDIRPPATVWPRIEARLALRRASAPAPEPLLPRLAIAGALFLLTTLGLIGFWHQLLAMSAGPPRLP